MSDLYTPADMMTARVAIHFREQCEHEASGRLSSPCVGCDLKVALDAVAPAIAARALREAAEAYSGRVQLSAPDFLRARAVEMERP